VEAGQHLLAEKQNTSSKVSPRILAFMFRSLNGLHICVSVKANKVL